MKKIKKFLYNGKMLTIKQLAKIAGVTKQCIYKRLVKHNSDATKAVKVVKYGYMPDKVTLIKDFAKAIGRSTIYVTSRLFKGVTTIEIMGQSRRGKINGDCISYYTYHGVDLTINHICKFKKVTKQRAAMFMFKYGNVEGIRKVGPVNELVYSGGKLTEKGEIVKPKSKWPFPWHERGVKCFADAGEMCSKYFTCWDAEGTECHECTGLEVVDTERHVTHISTLNGTSVSRGCRGIGGINF